MTFNHVNTVTLLGRLADDPARRPLPAGGTVTVWRLNVDRPQSPGKRRRVDTIACAAYDARLHDQAASWRRGDIIEVQGALRRRFWNADEFTYGRYEVEIHEAALVAVAPADLPTTA